MWSFTVILSLIVAINARADVSHLPTGSYLPSHIGSGSSHGSGSFGLGGHGGHSSFSSGSYHSGSSGGLNAAGLGALLEGFHGGSSGGFHGGSSGSFHGGSSGSFHGGSGGATFHGGSHGVGGGSFLGGVSHGAGGGSFHSGSSGSFHGGASGGFGSGGGFGLGGGFGGHGGFVHDMKHVYFYAAPEEYTQSRLRINIIPNSQRNTKIIFVKAPSYGGVTPEVIAPQSISEDKTLVYVLVKRPEHGGGQINIPAGAGVRPSKPEVYFIKYKTQQDAHEQIAGGVQGHHVGSHVSDVGNVGNFVSTLESSSSSHGVGIDTLGGTGGIDIRSGFTSGSVSSSSGSRFGPAGASGPY